MSKSKDHNTIKTAEVISNQKDNGQSIPTIESSADQIIDNQHEISAMMMQAQEQHATSSHHNQPANIHQFQPEELLSMHEHAAHHPRDPHTQLPRDIDKGTYLKQLLQDKKTLHHMLAYSYVGFHQIENLLNAEIVKVRSVLFQNTESPSVTLPDAVGEVSLHERKLFVPVQENPEYNFVGRILGPRGLTAKQLEQETQCKIMVRGRGSMRDKNKENANRNKPNWEHLNEDLHVLITTTDTHNRAQVKLNRAEAEVRKLLVPRADGEDDLKKKQLMELAIINGTYRDNSSPARNNRQVSNPLMNMNNMSNQLFTVPGAGSSRSMSQTNMSANNTQLGVLPVLATRPIMPFAPSSINAPVTSEANFGNEMFMNCPSFVQPIGFTQAIPYAAGYDMNMLAGQQMMNAGGDERNGIPTPESMRLDEN